MNKAYVPLVLLVCFWIGMQIGTPLGGLLAMSCNKPYEPAKKEVKKASKPVTIEIGEKGNKVSVRIINWDVDPEGLITAEWEYSDGRRGGTDWTEWKWIPILIKDQSHLPKCTNSKCNRVTEEGECWRHRPIPTRIDDEILDHI